MKSSFIYNIIYIRLICNDDNHIGIFLLKYRYESRLHEQRLS